MGTRAKASSIGSTDKRSQLSSDSIRKRDYLAITSPTMHQTDMDQIAEVDSIIRVASPFGATIAHMNRDRQANDTSNRNSTDKESAAKIVFSKSNLRKLKNDKRGTKDYSSQVNQRTVLNPITTI